MSDAQIDKFPAEYLGSDAHVRAMAERINRFAGQIVAAIAAGTIGGGTGGTAYYGKAIATWTSGNTVTLHPCNAAGVEVGDPTHVVAYINSPTTATPVGVTITAGDVLAYTLAPDGVAYLLPVKQGGSGGTVDVYQGATKVQTAAKFIRISTTRDTDDVLEAVAATISGDAGVDIIMKAAGTDKAALTYVSGSWGQRLIQFP